MSTLPTFPQELAVAALVARDARAVSRHVSLVARHHCARACAFIEEAAKREAVLSHKHGYVTLLATKVYVEQSQPVEM